MYGPLTVAGTALLLSTLFFASRRYLKYLNSDLKKTIRVPGGHWLWGHEYEAFKEPGDKFYVDNGEKLGHVYSVKGALFHPDILVMTDPRALSHIFTKHPYSYPKSEFIRPIVARILGKSLTWAEGDEHKRQRQSLASVFSPSIVKGMEPEIRTATEKLTEALQSHILGSSEKDVRIDLLDWTGRATLDVIGAVGFGHDFESGASPEAREIASSWRNTVTLGLGWEGFVGQLVMRTFPFIGRLPLAAFEKQAEIKNIVSRLALQIVKNRELAGQEKTAQDLLSVLMRANEKDDDLQLLLDHICTFVMSGHETTGSSINFAIHELAKDKTAQDCLRRELNEFAGSGANGEPTYEEYQTKLPYLDAVAKEALRLYPAASRMERVATQDDVLPLRYPITSKTGEQMNSIRITKGQVIHILPMAMQRATQPWGADGNVFRPERWLDTSEMPPQNTLTQGWNGLFTFSEGPRMCIGWRLAVYEYKIILSSLIKRFEFSDTGVKIETRWSSTLQPFIAGKEADGVQLPVDVRLAA